MPLSTERVSAFTVSDDDIVVGELQLQIPGVVDQSAAFRWDEIRGEQFVPSIEAHVTRNRPYRQR